MHTNWQMKKQNVIYPSYVILSSNKMEQNTDDTCYNMNGYHTKWKKPDTKDNTLYNFIYRKFPGKANL